MDLSRIIIGHVVTEKAERQKAARTYALHVATGATKIDVINALKKYYDVEISSVRVMRTPGKTRMFGRGTEMQKRHPMKKVMVTLTEKSKPLDLASFSS